VGQRVGIPECSAHEIANDLELLVRELASESSEGQRFSSSLSAARYLNCVSVVSYMVIHAQYVCITNPQRPSNDLWGRTSFQKKRQTLTCKVLCKVTYIYINILTSSWQAGTST